MGQRLHRPGGAPPRSAKDDQWGWGRIWLGDPPTPTETPTATPTPTPTVVLKLYLPTLLKSR